MFNNLNIKSKRALIASAFLYALIHMTLAPGGSFDPTKYGFWSAILGALLWAVLTGYLLNRYTVKKE
jgi:hypothetical protein